MTPVVLVDQPRIASAEVAPQGDSAPARPAMPLSPPEAAQLVFSAIAAFPSEDCTLVSASGRILRRNVLADRAMPPFDRVTMDGFALRAAGRRTATGARVLQVDGTPQAAGMMARTLPDDPDACIEIMTGAVLPKGADCVVPYEDTERDGNRVTLSAETATRLTPGAAVHRIGSDHAQGDIVVRAGTRLSGREIAVAAACGASSVTVAALPKIAVVSTGDELVEVASPVMPHQIRRSNDLALRASLVQAGFPLVQLLHLRDVPAEIEAGLQRVLAECDVVIATGGVSKGRHDHLPTTLSHLGVTKVFHGVAQRPGKPMWFGMSRRKTPVFALPGNPVSCFACLHRYVLPALVRASGGPVAAPRWVQLTEAIEAHPHVTRFLPVHVRSQPNGVLQATPDPVNTSGDFAGLIGTDGFVELPAQTTFPADHVVPFTAWT